MVAQGREGAEQAARILHRGDADPSPLMTHAVSVQVPDVDAHHARAQAAGAPIVEPLRDFPWGLRGYVMVDPGGHRWEFVQQMSTVEPEARDATRMRQDYFACAPSGCLM